MGRHNRQTDNRNMTFEEAVAIATNAQATGDLMYRLGTVSSVSENPTQVAVDIARELSSITDGEDLIIRMHEPHRVIEINPAQGKATVSPASDDQTDYTSTHTIVMGGSIQTGDYGLVISATNQHVVEQVRARYSRVLEIAQRALNDACKHSAIVEATNQKSLVDLLTGVPNRRYIMETILPYIEHVAARFVRGETQPQEDLGELIFDIDHFKRFNDTYGHVIGDKVLRNMAQFVNRSIRNDPLKNIQRGTITSEPDSFARYGGEEFIAWLRGPRPGIRAGALRLKNGIYQNVTDPRPISTSIGIAYISELASGLALVYADAGLEPLARIVETDIETQTELLKGHSVLGYAAEKISFTQNPDEFIRYVKKDQEAYDQLPAQVREASNSHQRIEEMKRYVMQQLGEKYHTTMARKLGTKEREVADLIDLSHAVQRIHHTSLELVERYETPVHMLRENNIPNLRGLMTHQLLFERADDRLYQLKHGNQRGHVNDGKYIQK